MFREMRRFKQQVSAEECIEILKTTKRGVLSVIGDDSYRKEGDWTLNITSVIAFGRIHFLEFIPEHMTGKLVNES